MKGRGGVEGRKKCIYNPYSTIVAVPLSHMCDTPVLTTATVVSPGDGTKLLGINKHCQLTEGITN